MRKNLYFLILPLLLLFGTIGFAQVTNETQGTTHADLQAAINAATAGDELKLTQDLSFSGTVNVNKQLLIDGDGYTVTVSGTGNKFNVAKTGAGSTIQNLKVFKSDRGNIFSPISANIFNIASDANNVTLDNVDVNGNGTTGSMIRDVVRGINVMVAENLVVKNSSFINARQVAYINLRATGVFENNLFNNNPGGLLVTVNAPFEFINNSQGSNPHSSLIKVRVLDAPSNYELYYTCPVMLEILENNPGINIDNNVLNVNTCSRVHNITQNKFYYDIQPAVDAANADDIIEVSAGEYEETVVVNKPLTLKGANAGVSGSDSRGAESVIIPQGWYGIKIESDDVTIDGFTIDGDRGDNIGDLLVNTSIRTQVLTGINQPTSGVNNLIVENNIIKNVIYMGVSISPTTQASTYGHRVRDNYFLNLGSDEGDYPGFGTAVHLGYHSYAGVTNNKMDNINVGIQTTNWHMANVNPNPSSKYDDLMWSDNEINTRAIGIYYNTAWGDADAFQIINNTITGVEKEAGAPKSRFVGIVFSQLYGNLTGIIAENNYINGGTTNADYSAGYEIWSVSEDANPLIKNSTVENVEIGVYVNNFSAYGKALRDTYATIEAVAMRDVGTGIKVFDSPESDHKAVNLTINENVYIENAQHGVVVENENASVSFDVHNLSFAWIDEYFTLIDNANDIDGRGTIYEGIPVSTMTPTQIADDVDSRITDQLDDPSLGLVIFFDPLVHNITQDTYYYSIYDAVAAAEANDEIELLGDIDEVSDKTRINKTVSINGNGYTVNLVQPTATAGGVANFHITASDVTIENVIFNRTENTAWSSIVLISNGGHNATIDNVTMNGPSSSSASLLGVEVSYNMNDLTVSNSEFNDLSFAGYVNGNSTGNILNNHTDGSLLNGWAIAAHSDLYFEGNTWGDNEEYDIYIFDENGINNYDCPIMLQIIADNDNPELMNELLDILECMDEEYIYDYDAVTDSYIWTPNHPSDSSNPADENDNVTVVSGNAKDADGIVDVLNAKNVTIHAGATLEVSGIMNVYGDLTIEEDGNLIFLSGEGFDGELGIMNGNISGNATVHRYMSDHRAYRMVSSPVNTGAGTIHSNWQEGVNNATINETHNPHPGFGTHITGSDPSLGFDVTQSGGRSLYRVDAQTQQFVAVPNTNNTSMEAGDAFLLFVRGDRDIDLNDPSNEAHSSTILRTTGELYNGDYQVEYTGLENGDVIMVGNPYQSVVDMDVVINSSDNVNTYQFYVYDPTLADQGGYVTVSYEGGEWGHTSDNSEVNQYLQPGQAFQIAADLAGTGTATVNVPKSSKKPGEHTASHRGNGLRNIVVGNLYTAENFNNGGKEHDNFAIAFSENYDNALTSADAVMPYNFDENIGIDNNGTYLSLERREMPQANEVYQLYTMGYRHTDYTLKLTVNGLEDTVLYLDDHYTGNSTLIEESTVFNFSVDADDALSMASDRFSIRVEERLGVEDHNLFSGINLYPNPLSNDTFYINVPQLDGEQVNVSITDLSGRLVYTENLDCVVNKVTVVTNESLSSGIYLVTVTSGGAKHTLKLLKE